MNMGSLYGSFTPHTWGIGKSLYCLHKDGEAESKKKYAVNQCSKNFCAKPSVGILSGCGSFGEL
jgi:hypothetical protein